VIEALKERLRTYSPDPLPMDHAHRDEAAVLVPVIDGVDPQLVLTLRAGSMASHAGEVAWPGGKRDAGDASLTVTALRESHEEIGLEPANVEVVGALRPFVSKHGLLVTPVVGIVTNPVALTPNPAELAAIFEVPVSWLADDPRTTTDVIRRHGETHRTPVYHFNGFKIWGLTAMILREVLTVGFALDIH